MPQSFDIRRASAADTMALVQFNQAMAMETEDKKLDAGVLEPGVREVLANERRGFYLVAELHEPRPAVVAGSLMVTYEWSDWRNGNFWWVQSVYVRPEHRGRGIYRALYERVRREARESGDVCGIRLYVERDNRIAQQVYETLGMAATHYLMYEEPLER